MQSSRRPMVSTGQDWCDDENNEERTSTAFTETLASFSSEQDPHGRSIRQRALKKTPLHLAEEGCSSDSDAEGKGRKRRKKPRKHSRRRLLSTLATPIKRNIFKMLSYLDDWKVANALFLVGSILFACRLLELSFLQSPTHVSSFHRRASRLESSAAAMPSKAATG